MIQKPFRGVQLNRTHPLAKGLVGCWLFNEATGETVFDSSGNGNNGTLENGVTWGDGGLVFDGSDDYVDCGNNASLQSDAISVSTNIKTPSVLQTGNSDERNTIIARYDWDGNKRMWGLVLNNPDGAGQPIDRLSVLLGDPNDGTLEYIGRYEVDLLPNTDYDVCFTFDSGTLILYVNGTPRTLTTTFGFVPASLYSTNVDLYIGAQVSAGAPGQFSKLTQDRTRIYNRALSAEETAWLYREPYAMFNKPLSPTLLYVAAAAGVPNAGALMMTMM